MRNIFRYIIFCLIAVMSVGCSNQSNKSAAEKLGWKLSMQSYTFHKFTLVEAIDKTAELGVKYMEVYPKQVLGGSFGDVMFNYDLSPELRKGIKQYAESKNVKLIATGVLVPKREELKDIFEFASDMGMDYISAEPAKEDWDIVEQLAKEYGIKVATHNHPSEKSYWKPQVLLDCIDGRSKLLGSNCDIGHFKRMNEDPLSCVKQLEGRIISMHFKDLAQNGDKYSDVVWGKGVLDLNNILKELKRQHYKGYITIEYEANWDNNVPLIRESIEYFNGLVENL
ncbi:MAG: sugar phosphate isomerase/epimerase family protein [Fermentimonas sp.]|jgi:L-ribulose-5-phosphate 3-epimerase